MEKRKGKASNEAKRLEDTHRRLFSGAVITNRSTVDSRGNFIMPSAYQPSKTVYTSQVN